jgi:hypothetical protein
LPTTVVMAAPLIPGPFPVRLEVPIFTTTGDLGVAARLMWSGGR